MKRLIVVSLPLILACSAGTSQRRPLPASDTSSGPIPAVVDSELADLTSLHWQDTMRTNPVWATMLGDHRYDDKVRDVSAKGLEKERTTVRNYLTKAKKIQARGLEGSDATTLRLFTDMLQHQDDAAVCEFETWTLSPRGNPVTQWNELAESHRVKTVQDGSNLAARFEQAATQIDNNTSNLARGATKGVYANRESVRRVLEMVDRQLAQPVADWPMTAPAKKTPDDWSDDDRIAFAGRLIASIDGKVKPALERYRAMLKDKILPNARGADQTGLGALPFGEKCYEARIRNFTGLPLSAKDLHQTGHTEIARINAEMVTLGEKLFGTNKLPEILERLRTDPSIFFDSEDAIVKKAEAALAKARAAMPNYFGVLPKADCIVQKIPDYEAPFTTIAYYKQPVPDGSKPGEFFINVYQPKTRPKYEMEALAYHEAIPGHHLQIAIAQERPAMPKFRKHLGQTAFVEGWALYTEQLADEMGLYSGDLDRMGMLSYEAWRAARLVVDTGIHAMGWSRDRAKAYMLAHTALAANNVDNEVDRYIVWPGQALGYKTGQLEIWRLRRDAEKTLGDKFDIKGFHDAVLRGGAVSLPVLQGQVAEWVKSRLN